MKKLFTLLCIISITFSYSQLDEGQKIHFDFIKVEKENIEEYEAFMTDYIGKVAETAVKKGKLENWIFRKVAANSMHNSGFTHMVLWVAPDQSIPWSDVWEETYPNLSKESREWIGSKGAVLSNKLYTAYTTYVTGFSHAGEDVVNYIATYNLIKAESGKLSDYIEFEKNMKTTLEKHAPKLKGWHALTRNGSVARAQGAWDFMTIDNFANAQDANQLWWTDIPQKIRQNNSKKYGNVSELRTIRHRVLTRLIYDAKNGKYQN